MQVHNTQTFNTLYLGFRNGSSLIYRKAPKEQIIFEGEIPTFEDITETLSQLNLPILMVYLVEITIKDCYNRREVN